MLVSAKDLVEVRGRRARCARGRQNRRRRCDRCVSYESLEPCGCAEDEYACGVAVDAEPVRHTERDDGGAARVELEALLAATIVRRPSSTT